MPREQLGNRCQTVAELDAVNAECVCFCMSAEHHQSWGFWLPQPCPCPGPPLPLLSNLFTNESFSVRGLKAERLRSGPWQATGFYHLWAFFFDSVCLSSLLSTTACVAIWAPLFQLKLGMLLQGFPLTSVLKTNQPTLVSLVVVALTQLEFFRKKKPRQQIAKMSHLKNLNQSKTRKAGNKKEKKSGCRNIFLFIFSSKNEKKKKAVAKMQF